MFYEDRSYASVTHARARVEALHRRGYAATYERRGGVWTVFTDKVPDVPQEPTYGYFMEPPYVTEACLTEDGQKFFDTGSTYAETYTSLMRKLKKA